MCNSTTCMFYAYFIYVFFSQHREAAESVKQIRLYSCWSTNQVWDLSRNCHGATSASNAFLQRSDGLQICVELLFATLG